MRFFQRKRGSLNNRKIVYYQDQDVEVWRRLFDAEAKMQGYRTKYAPATKKAAQELRGRIRRQLTERWWALLRVLLKSPAQGEIGIYHSDDKRVHTDTCGLPLRITRQALGTSIATLNRVFRWEELPFIIWFECQPGSTRNRSNRHIPERQVPYVIGLLDTRRPLSTTTPEGSA